MTPAAAIRILSVVSAARLTRPLTRTPPAKAAARRWLWTSVLSNQSPLNDITILIGVRNRSDHRLTNSLGSIRNQTYPTELVRPMVVDYGSDPDHAGRTRQICDQFEADYVRVDDDGPWSRARCLNIGIRRAETKFLMTSDVDMVFSPSYASDAMRVLEAEPLSIVCAPMLDLPQEALPALQQAARQGESLDLEHWKDRAIDRFEGEIHPSLGVSRTVFYKLIRGYDEFFEVWGGEDRDLMRRLMALGLETRRIPAASYYLHQWHPKFEGVAAAEDSDIVRTNRNHFRRNYSILRNGPDWGTNARRGS